MYYRTSRSSLLFLSKKSFLLNHLKDNQSWLFACLKSLFVAAKKNDFITSVHQTFREHKAKRRVT